MAGRQFSTALADRLAADRAIHRWVAETLGRGGVPRPEDRPGGRPG